MGIWFWVDCDKEIGILATGVGEAIDPEFKI